MVFMIEPAALFGTDGAIGALVGLCVGAIIVAAIAHAIARRRLAAARESEKRARTAERLAEVGAMTGGLAHELKNPLSTIRLNAQLLAEAIGDLQIDAEERDRLVRRMGALHRETERLGDILEDFLNYAGEMRLSTETLDINQVVEELGDFLHPQMERDRIRLRLDLATGGVQARADALRLKQALLNLMLNAAQAMASSPESATRELIIRTARNAPDTTSDHAEAEIHVMDTGPGMDEITRAKIFEPYFTTKRGGVGLGLPTTRRIIEAHGGRLDVHSEPGRGTAFIIHLPPARETDPNNAG